MTIIKEQKLNGGTQVVHRFKNGYGASVIKGGRYAYGGHELAVLLFDGDRSAICYDTPLTNDVIGHLTDDKEAELLKQIKALPKRKEKK